MAFKSNMWDTHHQVNKTLTPSKRGIWIACLKIKFFTCAFSNFFTYVHIFIKGLHPSHHPYYKSIRFSLTPNFATIGSSVFLILLERWYFCSRTFIMKLASTCKWLIKTNVDNSELKCPSHQGSYEKSKFIGMHPGQEKGWCTLTQPNFFVFWFHKSIAHGNFLFLCFRLFLEARVLHGGPQVRSPPLSQNLG